MFDRYLTSWGLTPDATPFDTLHSWVLHVRADGAPATLKMRKPESDETLTAAMLSYYGGQSAVRLLSAEGDVVLMERACGSRSLWEMTLGDRDGEATGILAEVLSGLHAPRTLAHPHGLTPLDEHFAPLLTRAHADVRLNRARDVARELLASSTCPGVLHGDLHHNNVLFDAARGWLAIDPKGLLGDRAYDIANLICNPWPHGRVAHDKERAQRCASICGARLGLDRRRVLAYAVAHAGLSAVWSNDDGSDPRHWLLCVELFATLL